MNVTKFVMLLLFGVVCANVGAIRQLEGETNGTKGTKETKESKEIKETKYNISIPSNGVVAELSITVQTRRFPSSLANAINGGPDPNGTANGISSVSASGSVVAVGPNAMAYSGSNANTQSDVAAVAVPNGFNANGFGSGSAHSYAFGRTG